MVRSYNYQKGRSDVHVEQKKHARALGILSLTIFLLMADPLLNVYIGPAPIYAIDFLVFLTWINANRISPTQRYPLRGLVIFIIVAMIVSEMVAGIRLGTLLQPTYLIIRNLLGISLFFSTPKIIQDKSDLMILLKAGLLGALVTATLMITSSLPQTQGIVARHVFSHSFLFPSAEKVAALYGSAGIAMRGYTLVGVSILSGAFLNTIWPLLFLLHANEKPSNWWKAIVFVAMLFIPLAIIMSYSRGQILGLLLIVMMVLLLRSSKARRPIVIGVGIVILIFSWIGWDSPYFKFDWLQSKTQYDLGNLYGNRYTDERIFAYSEPFQHLVEHPEFLFFGQGYARRKVSGNILLAGYDAATHSEFAAAYYGYGMLTAFAYLFLLLRAFRMTWNYAWRSKNDFLALFSGAMLASLTGLLPWFLLDHSAVDEPRGTMLLFFIFGLVAVQRNFARTNRSEKDLQREKQFVMNDSMLSPVNLRKTDEIT
jgi:hypothetical protein